MKNTQLIVLLILAAPIAFASDAAKGDVRVTISRDAEGHDLLEGGFSIEASTSVAWAVLTDYDGMGSFVSSIRSSRLLERRGDVEIVEQLMRGKAGIFRKPVHLILEVKETSREKISFRDVSKKSFRVYEGAWEIIPLEGRLEVRYFLKAKPDFFAPDFLAISAFKNTAMSLLTEVRNEIASRQSVHE
jgi:hypothetical protein